MTRPRIALVTDAIHPYHRGGKEIRYYEVAGRLSKRADVDVYTMRWWTGPRTFGTEPLRYIGLAPLRPLYTGGRRSIPQALGFAMSCLRLLLRRFDALEADHMPYLQLFPLRVVTWLRRRRFVVTWHEVWGPAYWRSYLGPLGTIGWWIERAAMSLPDEILAASEDTAVRLTGHLGARATITVAPNGVDMSLARGAMPASDWAGDIIAVGRQLPHKRLDRLIDAVALLHERGRTVSCRIVGDGPQHAELVEKARAAGVDSAIVFDRDVTSQPRLYSLLRASRVFAFPSEREGFGIAALEALVCGLPVVTTSAPDNLAARLVERDSRSIVCAPTTAAFADALERCLDAAETNSGPCPGWLAAYDWDHVADLVRKACLR